MFQLLKFLRLKSIQFKPFIKNINFKFRRKEKYIQFLIR